MIVYRMEWRGHGVLGGAEQIPDHLYSLLRRTGAFNMPCLMNDPLLAERICDLFDVEEFDDAYDAISDLKFGCTSWDQFLLWFPLLFHEELMEKGVRILEFNIPDDCVIVGEFQCVF